MTTQPVEPGTELWNILYPWDPRPVTNGTATANPAGEAGGPWEQEPRGTDVPGVTPSQSVSGNIARALETILTAPRSVIDRLFGVERETEGPRAGLPTETASAWVGRTLGSLASGVLGPLMPMLLVLLVVAILTSRVRLPR